MDGKTLYRSLEITLGEKLGATFLDSKMVYDCFWAAAIATTERTRCFTSTQSITTVADQRAYDLNTDFLGLAWKDSDNRYFIKYNDGTNITFLYPKPYDTLLLANQTTSVSIPSYFSLVDKAQGSVITGICTSAGALSNGEATLTDANEAGSGAATFVTSGVSVGDSIYNVTDDAEGIILTVTSETALKTAMFHGTDNDWDTAGGPPATTDSYRIYPQQRIQLQFDPPPLTAGHTVTVYYVQRPAPVYSPLRFYNFNPQMQDLLISYAAWKYKYIDQEPNFGDGFYKFWDLEVRKFSNAIDKMLGRSGFRVNLKKSSKGYQSYR